MFKINQQNASASLYLQNLRTPSFKTPVTKKFSNQEDLSLAHKYAWQGKEPFFYVAFSNKAERMICSIITKLETISPETKHENEEKYGAILYPSGMAAIYNLMDYLLQKKRGPIVLAKELYVGTKGIATNLSKAYNVPVRKLGSTLHKGDSFVFLETVSNPSMQSHDIPVLARACKRKNIVLVVDNTVLTSMHIQVLREGADYVVYSGSKTLTGHATVCGAVVGKKHEISNKTFENLLWERRTTGACITDEHTLEKIYVSIKELPKRLLALNVNAKIICGILDEKNIRYKYPGAGPLIFLPNQLGIPDIPFEDSYGSANTSQYEFPRGLRLSVGYDKPHIEKIRRWTP